MKKERLHRSELAVPGTNDRAIEKAPALGADVVFLDLEDAVAPDDKERARGNVIEALAASDWSGCAISVRINGLDTHWCYRDVVEVVEGRGDVLDTLLVPKVGSPSDVEFVATLLDQIEPSDIPPPALSPDVEEAVLDRFARERPKPAAAPRRRRRLAGARSPRQPYVVQRRVSVPGGAYRPRCPSSAASSPVSRALDLAITVVPEPRFELGCPRGRPILSRLRLPVPPLRPAEAYPRRGYPRRARNARKSGISASALPCVGLLPGRSPSGRSRSSRMASTANPYAASPLT